MIQNYQLIKFISNRFYSQSLKLLKYSLQIQNKKYFKTQEIKLIKFTANQLNNLQMSFQHIFFNNQDVKRRIQKSANMMFPKITQQSVKKQKKVGSQSIKINSDKDLYNPYSKQYIKNSKNVDLYRMTTKDILSSKSKSIQHSDLSLLDKFKQKSIKKSEVNQSKKKKNQYLEEKMRQTTRNINKMRTTFIVRKSSILNEGSQNQLSANLNNKKTIGNYMVVKQIGHGGFAQVHQVMHSKSNQKFALKQYNLAEAFQCYKNESRVGEYFFENNTIKEQFLNEKGHKCIVKFIEKIKNNKKGYIIQQLAGTNFSKLISEIKGTFYNKERVYEVNFLPFYEKMKKKQMFTSVFLQICEGIKILNKNEFIHCDLKLQNILVKEKDNLQNDSYPEVKIIDFGSTFQSFKGLPKITITPEYMPPQLLMQFDKNNLSGPSLIYDRIDIWSIGCIMLEIFTGIPLWFRYKCKIESKERTKLELGIFALTNRDYQKIIKKQNQLCHSLVNSINFISGQWQMYRALLKKIFVMNPENRIKIDEMIGELQSIKQIPK